MNFFSPAHLRERIQQQQMQTKCTKYTLICQNADNKRKHQSDEIDREKQSRSSETATTAAAAENGAVCGGCLK